MSYILIRTSMRADHALSVCLGGHTTPYGWFLLIFA